MKFIFTLLLCISFSTSNAGWLKRKYKKVVKEVKRTPRNLKKHSKKIIEIGETILVAPLVIVANLTFPERNKLNKRRAVYHEAHKKTVIVNKEISNDLKVIENLTQFVREIKDSGDDFLTIKGSSKILLRDLYNEYNDENNIDNFIYNRSEKYYSSMNYSHSMFGLYKNINKGELNTCIENLDFESMYMHKIEALESVEDCIDETFSSRSSYVLTQEKINKRIKRYRELRASGYNDIINRINQSIIETKKVPMKLLVSLSGVHVGYTKLKKEVNVLEEKITKKINDIDKQLAQ